VKVAVLLYGQPRFLDNKEAYASQKKHLLDQYDCDVYAHIWHDIFNSENKVLEYSKWTVGPNNELYHPNIGLLKSDSNAVDKIQKHYNPVLLDLAVPRTFTIPKLLSTIQNRFNSPIYNEHNLSNFLSQAYSLEQASFLLQKFISDYDWIFWLRTDLLIKSMPDLNTLSPTQFYLSDQHPDHPDLSFVMGSQFLEAASIYSYMTSQKAIDNVSSMSNGYGESFKLKTYQEHYSMSDYCPIRWDLEVVRSN